VTRYIFTKGKVLVYEGPYSQLRGDKQRESGRGVLILVDVTAVLGADLAHCKVEEADHA